MMFEPDAEAMPAEQRAKLQEERLRGLVDRLLAAAGVQAERLRAAGVTSGADVGLADLPRLPMTEKKDLWAAYPFGMLGVPRSEVVVVPRLQRHRRAADPGRLHPRGPAGYGRGCAPGRWPAAGAGPGSIVHNAYGYGLFTGGLGFHQGAIELGATVVPVSGGMTPRQVTLIRDLQPDILTCTPSYAIRLGEALAEAGLRPGAGLTLRAGLFGAEPWTAALRARIEELLGLRALDIYGLSEVIGPGVAAECLEAADGLHVNEDHFLVEAVDPVTGRAGARGDAGRAGVHHADPGGAAAAAVPDRGHRRAAPRQPCACGRTLVKMSKITGRRDDMLVIRGVNVYPSEVERVLLGEAALSPDYLLVVDERGRCGANCWRCASTGRGSGPRRRRDLEARLREVLGVRVGVRVLPAGSGAADRGGQGGPGRAVDGRRAAACLGWSDLD